MIKKCPVWCNLYICLTRQKRLRRETGIQAPPIDGIFALSTQFVDAYRTQWNMPWPVEHFPPFG